jgi:hypothetical protein
MLCKIDKYFNGTDSCVDSPRVRLTNILGVLLMKKQHGGNDKC